MTAPGLCANDYEALRERFEAHGSLEEVRTFSSMSHKIDCCTGGRSRREGLWVCHVC